jgi:hypothetical protein
MIETVSCTISICDYRQDISCDVCYISRVKTVYLGIKRWRSRSVNVNEYKLDVVHTIINVFLSQRPSSWSQNDYEEVDKPVEEM